MFRKCLIGFHFIFFDFFLIFKANECFEELYVLNFVKGTMDKETNMVTENMEMLNVDEILAELNESIQMQDETESDENQQAYNTHDRSFSCSSGNDEEIFVS